MPNAVVATLDTLGDIVFHVGVGNLVLVRGNRLRVVGNRFIVDTLRHQNGYVYGIDTPHRVMFHVMPKQKLLQMEKGGKLTYEEKVEYYKTVNHKLYSQVNSDLMKEVITTFNGTFGE